MGSKSDLPAMEKAEQELTERGIRSETRVMSAHREPDVVADYAKNAQLRGLRVIIAGAGLSAALPGVVAAHTDLPVIGVPLTSRTSVAGGLDALLSISQMPPGVPVACVGRRQRPQRRGAGGAHPECLDVPAAGAETPRSREPVHPRREPPRLTRGRAGRAADPGRPATGPGCTARSRRVVRRAWDPRGLLDRRSVALCSHVCFLAQFVVR